MNARPIVLPGITTGLVLLAAMVGFVQLPAEGSTASAAERNETDISLCRTVLPNAAALDLEGTLDAAAEKSSDGKVGESESTALLNALNNLLGQVSQQNLVSDPSLSKNVQNPLSDFYSTSVRALVGSQNGTPVTTADVTKIQDAYGDLTKACDVADA